MTPAAATGSVTGPAALSPAGRSLPEPSAAVRWRRNLWPLGLYALLSLLLFGVPVLGHFGSRIIAQDAIDSSQFMWFFSWWPHALLHGLNPFVTNVIFVPQGFNLSWATAMPGPSILLAPVTLAFGPAATWNVIALSAPALSAWTAFLLCRHVTGRVLPSLVGGYVFGFSPYVLKHLTGGPFLALVPLLPLFVLLVLRRVDGSLPPRRFVVAMTAALTAQYLISSEVLLSSTLFGAIASVVGFALFAELRAALIDVVKLLVIAYAATVILISPFLYYFFFGHHYPPTATFFPADLTSYAIPPSLVVALTRHQPPFAGSNDESYLGLPLIVLVCLFLWQQRRNRTAWLIVISALIAGISSLGGYLWVRGHMTSIPLPWKLVGGLPVLRYAITLRFAVFVVLPAALVVAMWLSRGPNRGRPAIARWGLVLLALAFIIPDVGSSVWRTHVEDPAFFSSGTYRTYLKPSDHVLTIPAWGPNDRWQADTGFRFKLADGYVGQGFPASYTQYPIWYTLVSSKMIPGYASQLRRFVAAKGVTAIVVDETQQGPWRQLFGSLGVQPVSTGGVLFYRLRASS